MFLRILALVVAALMPLSPALAGVDRDRSQELYEEALDFFRQDAFPEALIQLRNALQQDPNNLPARIMLGRILLEQNQPMAAIKELEKAQAMGGDENLLLLPLAMAYLEVAQPEHVITGFVAEGHNPDVDGQLQLLQAEAYIQLGDPKRAEELFLNAGTLLPVDPRPILGRARLDVARGKRDKAHILLAEALVLAPDSFDVWIYKAILHRDEGNFREAIAAFDKVLALNPVSERALTARAALWLDLGQDERARADLEAVKNLGTDTLESIYLRTLLLYREGRMEEARAALSESGDKINEIKDDTRAKLPETMLMLGVVAYFEENYTEAATHFTAYLNRTPNHLGAMRYLASCYLSLGDAESVVTLLKPTSGGVPPRDPMLLSILAEAFRSLGNYGAAEQYYSAALELAPGVAGIGVRLAASRLDAGRPDAAIAELEKLTQRFPELAEAWIQLARVHVKTGDMAKAIVVVEEMLARFKGTPEIHNVAGATFLAAGEFERARLELNLAKAADSEALMPQLNLARLARAEGDVASAEALYRATLERFPTSVATQVELSQVLLQQGAYDDARERVAALIKSEPTVFAAHELRLNVMFASKEKPERIRETLFDLVRAFPEEPRTELLAGRAYRKLGDLAEARMHLRRAVEAAGFDTEVLFAAANQQYGIGDFSGALWTLTKAEQGGPGNLGVGILKAATHIELKEFGKARETIDSLIARHGEKPTILTVQGDLLMAQELPAEAVQSYARVYQLEPGTRTMQTLFRAQVAANQPELAAVLMQDWLAGNPEDIGSMHLYAQMLMMQQRWDDARQTYERLQAAGTEDIIMLNNLAVCYQHLDDARALPTAEAAFKSAPKDPNVADTYGWILLEEGKVEEGLAVLREAFARASTSPAIRYHIGLALARLGRESEAQEEIEAAVDSGLAFSSRDDATSLLEQLRQKLKQ